MPIRDLAGKRFGRLRIPNTAEPEIRDRHAYWPYVCDCGRKGHARGSKLVAGGIVSCGCERADPNIRQAARMKTSARQRKAIARMGGEARRSKREL